MQNLRLLNFIQRKMQIPKNRTKDYSQLARRLGFSMSNMDSQTRTRSVNVQSKTPHFKITFHHELPIN